MYIRNEDFLKNISDDRQQFPKKKKNVDLKIINPGSYLSHTWFKEKKTDALGKSKI